LDERSALNERRSGRVEASGESAPREGFPARRTQFDAEMKQTQKKRRWCETLERLIRAVDPAFHEPCYFVDKRQARAAGISRADHAYGFTSLGLDADLRPLLERQGRWQGRGFAACVDLEEISTSAVLAAVALHEFCHYVQSLVESAPYADVLIRLAGRACFDKVMNSPTSNVGVVQPRLTRVQTRDIHNADFLRLVCHVQYRARLRQPSAVTWRADNRTRMWAPLDRPEWYGFPYLYQWRGALGDECEQLRDWPLVSVCAMAPPRSYETFSAEAQASAQHLLF